MSVIDEVKQRLDIVEVISAYLPLAKAGRNFRAICPFHSEKNPSFYVYPERQSWHCFGACSTGGDVFSFVMKKEGLDFGETLRLLAGRVGVTVPSRQEPEAGKDERERLYQANAAAAQYFHDRLLNSPAGKKARGYLESRGVQAETTRDFQLGYSQNSWEGLKKYLTEQGYTEAELGTAGLTIEGESGGAHDRFRNKLMFPIFDVRGRITGFGARVLDDSLPKYINSPQTPLFDKSSTLYGINLATTAIRRQDMAIIVEGYLDVLTAHQNGFSNVVASMGTAITEKQVAILKKLSRNLTLALHADAAGEEAMLRCVDYENTLETEIKVVILPEGRDPDDVIKENAKQWPALLDKAVPVVDYTIDSATAGLDLATAMGKSATVNRLLPIIARMKDTTRQDHYLNKLARLTGTSYNRLEAALNKLRDTRQRRGGARPEDVSQVTRPALANPREEYCLTLLLQHPELKKNCPNLKPEYFEDTENRVIFTAWQETQDIASLKESLDPTIHGRIDHLTTKTVPPNQIERKLADCTNQLHKYHLRNLKEKRAESIELDEQDIKDNEQLREVFTQERRIRSGQKEAAR
jgi:DNA primase